MYKTCVCVCFRMSAAGPKSNKKKTCKDKELQECIGIEEDEYKVDTQIMRQCRQKIKTGAIQFCSKHPQCRALKEQYDTHCDLVRECDQVNLSLDPKLWELYRKLAEDLRREAQTCANNRRHFTLYCVHPGKRNWGHREAVRRAQAKANTCERVANRWQSAIDEREADLAQQQMLQLQITSPDNAEHKSLTVAGANTDSPAYNTRLRTSGRKLLSSK